MKLDGLLRTLGQPLIDVPDAVVGSVALTTSIIEQQQAQETLMESEERYRLAIDVAALGTWRHDFATPLVHLDARAQAIWGFDYSDVDVKEMIARIDSEDNRHLQERFVIASQSTGDGNLASEFRIIRPDGVVRWVALRARLYFKGEGSARKVALSLGTYLDITERKQAEEAVRASEARFRAFIDHATDAFYLHDESGRVLDVNQQACENLYYTREELIGMMPTEFDPDVTPAFVEQLTARLNAGELVAFDSRHRRKDGSTFPVEVRIRPITMDGRLYHLALARDLTERKMLEEQFRQAHKMEAIGQLAGGVAHDFNNLIGAIRAYGELLRAGEPPLTGNQSEFVVAILDAVDRAARLTEQLLALGRKAIVAPKVLDLNAVIESTANMLRRLIGEDISMSTVLAPHLGHVKIDPGQVEQLIMNLAVNARDAMPMGGLLTIKTSNTKVRTGEFPGVPDLRPGPFVQLTVTDTGHGISDDVKPHIFEPFFTTKGVEKSTGLGLATVFGIVKQAGGHIAVESRVGEGATFVILLPTQTGPLSPLTEPEMIGLPVPRGSETLLLVEDEDAVRASTRMLLELQGYHVIEAASAAEALRAVDELQGQIDLLITDVVMSGLGGRELADIVRARRPNLKVLYMSGYTDDAVVRYGVSAAIDTLLQKPFTLRTLAQKIREMLDRPCEIAPAP